MTKKIYLTDPDAWFIAPDMPEDKDEMREVVEALRKEIRELDRTILELEAEVNYWRDKYRSVQND